MNPNWKARLHYCGLLLIATVTWIALTQLIVLLLTRL
jgi:hypothetical protein